MTNLFRGVNPHLGSLLQTPGTEETPSLWSTFHASHIIHLADLLNEYLPAHYTAYPERSLQIRELDWGDTILFSRPRPDVTIFRREGVGTTETGDALAMQPTWEAAIAEVIDPVQRPVAVVIRAATPDSALGQVVTRIEVLSPSNKPGGSHASAYKQRRIEALESGVPLVEVDYLHEQPPIIPAVPFYPHDPDALPYMIVVSDPRPNWEQGRVAVYGFGIDMPVPSVPIPLLDADVIVFDFDAAYQRTFTARRYASLIAPHAEPPRFDTYSPADRARIRAKLPR